MSFGRLPPRAKEPGRSPPRRPISREPGVDGLRNRLLSIERLSGEAPVGPRPKLREISLSRELLEDGSCLAILRSDERELPRSRLDRMFWNARLLDWPLRAELRLEPLSDELPNEGRPAKDRAFDELPREALIDGRLRALSLEERDEPRLNDGIDGPPPRLDPRDEPPLNDGEDRPDDIEREDRPADIEREDPPDDIEREDRPEDMEREDPPPLQERPPPESPERPRPPPRSPPRWASASPPVSKIVKRPTRKYFDVLDRPMHEAFLPGSPIDSPQPQMFSDPTLISTHVRAQRVGGFLPLRRQPLP